jgi:hypothetical protein
MMMWRIPLSTLSSAGVTGELQVEAMKVMVTVLRKRKKVILACEAKGIKVLMGFKQHWNKELIAQFYVTIYFGYVPKEDGRSERAVFWMTEGENHHLSFSNFLTLFRLPDDGFARKLHDESA